MGGQYSANETIRAERHSELDVLQGHYTRSMYDMLTEKRHLFILFQ
jgi:hypothetical protein